MQRQRIDFQIFRIYLGVFLMNWLNKMVELLDWVVDLVPVCIELAHDYVEELIEEYFERCYLALKSVEIEGKTEVVLGVIAALEDVRVWSVVSEELGWLVFVLAATWELGIYCGV